VKLFLLFLLLSLSACSIISFNLGNDIAGGSDSNFSNSAEIKGSIPARNAPTFIKDSLGSIPVPRLFDSDPTETTRFNIGVRQDMYTPVDLLSKDIIENDNPYAGTLTLDSEKVLATNNLRISTKIRTGVSGDLSLAGSTQIFVHDTLTKFGRNQKQPSGWDNQIETEPLFNIDYQRSWEDGRGGVNLFEYATQGMSLLRLGNIFTDATLQYGFKVGYNLPKFDRSNSSVLSIYLFDDVFGSGRLQNIYYDGGVFRDSVHTVDKELLVYGIRSGAAIEYSQYSLKFTYQVQSRDFKQQSAEVHAFGLLALGVDW